MVFALKYAWVSKGRDLSTVVSILDRHKVEVQGGLRLRQ